jgi:hypothetical protein
MKRLRKGEYRAVSGRYYGTPKEVWGFRSDPVRGRPETVARRFLAANARLFGLRSDLSGLLQRPARTLESRGATHVIFQQSHRNLRMHRAYVTVHIDRHGSVYLTKNRAMPNSLLPKRVPAARSAASAIEHAFRETELGKREAERIGDVEKLWFPRGDALRLAHKVRLATSSPREEWIIYIDAQNGRVLNRYDNLASVRGFGRVFNPNPVIALGGHRAATTARGEPRATLPARAYTNVRLLDLDLSGHLQGKRVTTELTRGRAKRADYRFMFDARRARERTWFKEVMVYYHVDNAVRYLERIGYRGPRAIFTKPIPVNVNGTREDNSWYSPGERALTFGTGGVDDAEDGETILHEFGHALQDAIVPDFGQSLEAAAMGEGFGDYFAASFFAPFKSKAYQASVMSWDAVTYPDYDPPCLRRVDADVTFEDFDHAEDADEHTNGMIWSAVLWDVRGAFGRARADRIIVDSHFQLDGFTTFARGARAIIDANRNLYADRDRDRLVRIFSRRGIGPVE